MKLKEAREILNLSQNATPEEAKKRYREYTKLYHPDINKEHGAEDKFKKINEAYQCVSTGKDTERQENRPQQSWNPFNINFGHEVQVMPTNLYTTISFKESVLGCKKELKFNRDGKCTGCNGLGQITLNNGCGKCNGRGTVTTQKGNMIFTQTCDKCFGRTNTEVCKNCNGNATINSDVVINVNIPGGVNSGNILRLSGMGSFIGSVFGLDSFSDAHLHITVTPDSNLQINGRDVISNLEITLLEALQGCLKNVPTIHGLKEINIPTQSKNKEEIIIPNLGVNEEGSQRVILSVIYPENIDDIINILSK